MGRVFANRPGDLGSIPGNVIPKTLKMVLDTSLRNTQQYKVRIKGIVEQSRERSSNLPVHLGVVAVEKGAFWSPSTTVANFIYDIVYWQKGVKYYSLISPGKILFMWVLSWPTLTTFFSLIFDILLNSNFALLLILKISKKRTRNAGHCWRSKDELISDVLLWTPTYGRAKAGRPAWTYIQQLCEDTGCNPEDLPEAMNDREKWRERVRDIRAGGTTWWWWWWFYECKSVIVSTLFCLEVW